jgi:4-amino-4-deoxy-L-arabinose transferase-like glycosyltransferase
MYITVKNKNNTLTSVSSFFLHPRVQIAAIVIFGIFLIFTKLDKGELAGLDDGYYAQKAKEILTTGDWMTMHFAGVPRYDNPPFFLWLQAIIFKICGANEYTARFWSAFFGLCTIVLIYLLGRLWYSHRVGTYAAIVMLTTQVFLKYARRGMMDVTLAFLVTLALYCFWKSFENKRYIIGFVISTAAAILTKSILGLFPILVAGAYLLVSRQWRRLYSIQFLAGSAIAIALASGWFIYEIVVNGSIFLEQHFGWLIVARAFTTSAEKQHWYSYFWYIEKLFEHYLPWVFFAVYGVYLLVRRNIKQIQYPDILLICWIVVVIAMMSVANERKVWYILPSFPALAVVCSIVIDGILSTDQRRIRFYQAAFGFLLLVSIIMTATPVRLDTNRNPDLKAIAHFIRNNPPGVKEITNYRISAHWLHRTPLMFYSDVDLGPPFQTVALLKGKLVSHVDTPLLTFREFFQELNNDSGLEVHPIMMSGSLIYCTVRKK